MNKQQADIWCSVETSVPPAKTKTTRKRKSRSDTQSWKAPAFNVIFLDDDDHTYEYVIEMLAHVFGHSRNTAFQMACKVDATGRVIVFTGSQERAEMKRDQVHGYGADWRISRCQGSMSAVVEPVE